MRKFFVFILINIHCLSVDAQSNEVSQIADLEIELSQKSPQERNRLYWNLPQGIREKLIGHRRQEAKKRFEEEESRKQRRREIQAQGSMHLEFIIGDYFKAAGESAAKQIEKPSSRRDFLVEIELKTKELSGLITKTEEKDDGVGNVELWEKYKPIYESTSSRFPYASAKPESVIQIEQILIDPLLKDLRGKE